MKTVDARDTGEMADLNWQEICEYEVYDAQDRHIGAATALWNDETGQPAFLGVKTTWLFGKTHVVPAAGVEVNQAARRLRVPYLEEVVKDAPHFEPSAELDDDKERQIRSYYGEKGRSTGSGDCSCASSTEATSAQEERPEAATMELKEEQIKVGKKEVETGGVRLRKIVRTERVSQPVELQREEIVVERVPGQSGDRPASEGFEGEEIYIPLRREEAVVEKETRVREQVRVRKERKSDKQDISETVRKEDVEMEGDEETGDSRRGR